MFQLCDLRYNCITLFHGFTILFGQILHFQHGSGFILLILSIMVRALTINFYCFWQWLVVMWYFSFIRKRYPFDWRTPYGYLVAWLAQCAAGTTVGCSVTQFLNLVFGSCWLFIFIAEDIAQDVAAFNIIAATTPDKKSAELMKRFCDMVQIHLDAKQ